MSSGGLALLGGVFLLANAQLLAPGREVPQQNPFPPTNASLALGRQLYQEHCQQCHGEAGRGDGPLAPTLDPPPLDLGVHVPLHPDRQLFLFVHDGVAGTAMAPWGGRLADEEIWHLVNYMKTFRPVAQ